MHRQHDWETIGVTPNNKWSTSNTVNQTICYFQMLICLLKKVVDSSIWLPHLTALLHRRRISGGRGSADSLKKVLLHADPWKPSQTLGFFWSTWITIFTIYIYTKQISFNNMYYCWWTKSCTTLLAPWDQPSYSLFNIGAVFGCQKMKLNAKILHDLNDKRHPTLN